LIPRRNVVYLKTADGLFEHQCGLADMKISGYNPKSLTYYCQVCGGKLEIGKPKDEWGEIFDDPESLQLTDRIFSFLEPHQYVSEE
jgi:hypothetical protein